MDPRLVDFYDQELKYLRETAREFGAAYPTLAARLGVNAPGEADPYVERLLEGVAFLAARVQLKLADEFPKFTQHLMDAIYPHYLTPAPSMAVLAFEPIAGDPALDEGQTVPRWSQCRMAAPEKGRADCVYSTGQAVTLWPIKVTKVEYLGSRAAVAGAAGDSGVSGEGGVLIRLEAMGEAPFSALPIDELTFYLGGAETLSGRIYEQLAGHATGVCVAAPDRKGGVARAGGKEAVTTPAFADDAALIPTDGRAFRGYRVLQEYFACPERFQFIRVSGLRKAFSRIDGKVAEIAIATDSVDKRLVGAISDGAFRLFCTPVINLFEKRCDPVLLDSGEHEFRVVAERMRQFDFEIYRILDVYSEGSASRVRRTYHPIYRADPRVRGGADNGFYTARRLPTRTSTLYPSRRLSDYAGTDLWIALSEMPSARGTSDQLSVRALCTNRDIADSLRGSGAQLEFAMGDQPFIQSIKAVLRPTRPRLPVGFEDPRLLDGGRSSGDRMWRLIGHLRANYETLFADEASAARLREHLALYARLDSPSDKQMIEGLTSARDMPSVRRVASNDPLAFARGRRIELSLDERNFADGGAYLFAQVLDLFLSEFAAVNSFVETDFSSPQRGRIAHWGPRRGERPVI